MATRRRVPRGRLSIRGAAAGRAVLPVAAAVTIVPLAFASGYGYLRDEL